MHFLISVSATTTKALFFVGNVLAYWEDFYCLYLILLSPKIEKRFCRPNLKTAQFLNEPRSAQVQGLLLKLQYQVVALSLTPWSGLPELGSGLSAQF